MLNYNREMEKIISNLNGEKPKLLMHACCAPCASACIERVKDYFDLTVWFYNPNMDSEEEYIKRKEELLKLCDEFKVKAQIAPYNKSEFLTAVSGLEDCREGGARCRSCFNLRLKATAQKCKADGYDCFTTTLTVSPLKNAELLNEIGERLAEENGARFLPSDFKKKGGYLRSIELSKEFDLYRQNYCGCEFSKIKNPK